jgi:hypothetical protein
MVDQETFTLQTWGSFPPLIKGGFVEAKIIRLKVRVE